MANMPASVMVVSADALCVDGYPHVATREVAREQGAEFVLEKLPTGLSLVHLHSGEAPLTLDFVAGRLGFRLAQGRARQEALTKAVLGRYAAADTRVLDATAGLGRDAAILAAAGCQVVLLERNALLHALLADALRRAAGESFVERMTLLHEEAQRYFRSLSSPGYDVIYLDPMFAEAGKAAVKKELSWLRLMLPGVQANEEQGLLELARQHTRRRVVVKRASKAPWLAAEKPAASIHGKAVRFDIYTPL